MTSYLLAGISLVALAAVTVAGVQSTRLADARSTLATIQVDLDAAQSNLERVAREKATVERVLAGERDRAVTAERRASDLKQKIARLEGTAADGPVAPVLRDTIREISR